MVAGSVGTTKYFDANRPFNASYLTDWATVRWNLTTIFADCTAQTY